MPSLLIVYSSIDGHTKKVAAFVARIALAMERSIHVFNASSSEAAPSPTHYERTIVAGSVHLSSYPRALRQWVYGHAAPLNAQPSAFVSVCLGVLDAQPGTHDKLETILTAFFRRTGWQPHATLVLAGAIPYTQYDILKKWVMKRIARKTSGDIDTSRDYDYTDWPVLEEFTRRFIEGTHLRDLNYQRPQQPRIAQVVTPPSLPSDREARATRRPNERHC